MLFGVCLCASAHDFTATVDGQKLYFRITSKIAATAEVTYNGNAKDNMASEAEGAIEIPSKVKYGKTVYRITAIGKKAFCGAVGLTEIVMPGTVTTIDDFAFEGCTNLRKVDFPANALKFGQGTFFKCTSLQDLSFGSDWKVLDLTPYRWSDSLLVVTIPAKVEKIRNMKSLKSLREVNVDSANEKFCSDNGVLYSKDGQVLYGAPRGFQGTLRVKAGTNSVVHGALMDCPGITAVDFPMTLAHISFREMSRLTLLEKIIFRSAMPPQTAFKNGRGLFLLQVANTDVKIGVPKDAEKAYRQQLTVTPGEYYDSADGLAPYVVAAGELPGTDNIKGIKNIEEHE